MNLKRISLLSILIIFNNRSVLADKCTEVPGSFMVKMSSGLTFQTYRKLGKNISLKPLGDSWYAYTAHKRGINRSIPRRSKIKRSLRNGSLVDKAIPDCYLYLLNDIPQLPNPKPANYPEDKLTPYQWGLYSYGQTFTYQTKNGTNVVQSTKVEIKSGVDVNVLPALLDIQAIPNPPVVAVVDSGVLPELNELKPVLYRNENELNGNDKDDDNNGYVDDEYGIDIFKGKGSGITTIDINHGSIVSTVLAAPSNNGLMMSGINPYTKILSVNIFGVDDSQPVATTSDTKLIAGLNYIRDLKKQGVNIKVVNLSLGSTGSTPECPEPLLNAFKELKDLGIMSVIAAGNSSLDLSGSTELPSPIICKTGELSDSMIVTASHNGVGNIAQHSNYGAPFIEISAPGERILGVPFISPKSFPNSAFPGFYDKATDNIQESFSLINGTSFAAPHVSAAVSLMFHFKPDATLAEVKDAIILSAKELPGIKGKVVSNGILDITKAKQLLLGTGNVTPVPTVVAPINTIPPITNTPTTVPVIPTVAPTTPPIIPTTAVPTVSPKPIVTVLPTIVPINTPIPTTVPSDISIVKSRVHIRASARSTRISILNVTFAGIDGLTIKNTRATVKIPWCDTFDFDQNLVKIKTSQFKGNKSINFNYAETPKKSDIPLTLKVNFIIDTVEKGSINLTTDIPVRLSDMIK
jgi:hypothetical protein